MEAFFFDCEGLIALPSDNPAMHPDCILVALFIAFHLRFDPQPCPAPFWQSFYASQVQSMAAQRSQHGGCPKYRSLTGQTAFTGKTSET